MSEIDSYQHECIGMVACPSDYEIVLGNHAQRNLPLYLLKEDGLTATSWQAKSGDLLLGGGSGESAALRLSIPEAIHFFTRERRNDFESTEELVKAYWNMNQAFVFCEGYSKLGWTPQDRIEVWLAQHLVSFVLKEYPEQFGEWKGDLSLKQAGSICRLPTTEEKQMW